MSGYGLLWHVPRKSSLSIDQNIIPGIRKQKMFRVGTLRKLNQENKNRTFYSVFINYYEKEVEDRIRKKV